jgi:hypothetical protein
VHNTSLERRTPRAYASTKRPVRMTGAPLLEVMES